MEALGQVSCPHLKVFWCWDLNNWHLTVLFDQFLRCSSGMYNLKELSLISGKAAWMAYLVILASPTVFIYPLNLTNSVPMMRSLPSVLLSYKMFVPPLCFSKLFCNLDQDFLCYYFFFIILKYLYKFLTGKNNWYALQDVYCLDADGALFDAALLSAVAALSHCKSCSFSII